MKPLSPRTQAALKELLEFYDRAINEGIKPEEQRLLDKMN